MKAVSVLDLERNRFGKELFTTEEKIIRLKRIYDSTLCWLEECVQKGNPKGTGAATMILERVKIELNDMVRANDSTQRIIIAFEKSGPDDPKTNP